jgi:carbon-monoxide dehydrogenase large subunit
MIGTEQRDWRNVSYVGQRVPGKTNTRLVAGKGVFVDDIHLPRTAYMAVLRSQYARARIRSIDVTEAEKLPGVLYVLTGREILENTNPFTDETGMDAKLGTVWALVPEQVRYVGEPIAAVVAEDKFTAYEALDYIAVDYEELEPVMDRDKAMRPDSPLVEPRWTDNLMRTREARIGDPDAAFAEADGIVTGVVHSNLITGAAIEPRGVLATYEPHSDLLTLWSSTQNPHPLRVYLSEILRIPTNSIRVIQPFVGGAFGLKIPTFHEDPLVAYMARKLERPVKWIEERTENLQAGGHSRNTRFEYEASYKKDGTVTGLKAKVVADVGAPAGLVGWSMGFVTWSCIPGVYKIPNAYTELFVVVTNKCPWHAYRGFGKDAASYLMDRVIDHVARDAGLDTTAVRFKNFIPADEFPYEQMSGDVIDSGNYAGALKTLLEMVDYENFAARQAKARAEGRYIGLGIGQELTPEGCSFPGSLAAGGYDSTEVRVDPAGDVTVLTGVTSPGGGNETGIAQIVADLLGCELSRVRVIQGDTLSCPYGSGNYSSRSMILGGSAAYVAASEIREKMMSIASSMLEASVGDLDAEGGRFFVKGSPQRAVTIEQVATEAYRCPHGPHMEEIGATLEATRSFKIDNVWHQPEKHGRFSGYPLWPSAVSAAEVEVDPDTGHVKILKYTIVHDSGKIINPLLAEGQLHGGIAQGLGGAMFEELVYDEEGQLQTATFMDYTIPTAVEMPAIEIGHQETQSPFTPLGHKGVGESGVGAALGSLCGAVENALADLDVRITRLPLTPDNVWAAIQEARVR